MSDTGALERGYRRVLAWYPRSFRAENEDEDEVLAVLLATAGEGQTRVSPAEARDSAAVHALLVHQVSAMVGCPIAIGLWVWLASANGKGKDWARMLSGACFGVSTLAVLGLLAQHAATIAPANVIAASVVWAIGLASVVLIFTPAAGRYYRPELARG